jgi:hypothetical protein
LLLLLSVLSDGDAICADLPLLRLSLVRAVSLCCSGLMAQEDLSLLGFADQQPAATTPADTPAVPAKK